MKNKIILTDADGVLLDWEWAFSVWMQERGYTLTADNKKSYYLHHHYNELEERDSKKVVKSYPRGTKSFATFLQPNPK